MDKIFNLPLPQNLNAITDYLLNNCGLKIMDKIYRFVEIELYIYNKDHKDIFNHCHPIQQKMLHWYFHQMSEKEHSYKGGNYKGLDLTCGTKNNFCGILIRTIQNDKTKEITEGPCKIVDLILKITKASSVKELVCDKMENDVQVINNEYLTIVENKFKKEKIFKSPRIGLTLKKKDNLKLRKEFVAKSLRFLIFPDQIKKGKTMTILTCVIDGMENKDIIKYFDITDKRLNTLLENFKTLMDKIADGDITFDEYYGKDLKDIDCIALAKLNG